MFAIAAPLFVISCVAAVRVSASPAVQTSGKNDVREKNHKWILNQLLKADATKLQGILGIEFLTMSTGNNLFRLDADDKVNRDHQETAMAVFNLTSRLALMDRMFAIVNATMVIAADNVKESGEIENAMTFVCESIVSEMRDDPTLYEQYEAAKRESKKIFDTFGHKTYLYVLPKARDETLNVFVEVANGLRMKKTVANLVFYNQTSLETADNEDHYLLTKSTLELSKRPELASAVQNVYNKALEETATNLEIKRTKKWSPNISQELQREVSQKMMMNLEKNFEENPSLNDELENMKTTLASTSS